MPDAHIIDRGLNDSVAVLAARLPEPLKPLARVAYNYRWSWAPGGGQVFEAITPEGWRRANHNPVRTLIEATPSELDAAADDRDLLGRVAALDADLTDYLTADGAGDVPGPIAFLCAEFGLHRSLPVYSGGLGILAGDILKEASDLGLPMVGVGLFYRRGYFHQRIDLSGWQHEYWIEVDPDLLPTSPVLDDDGEPIEIQVPVWGRELALRIWRVDVGRVPLLLLDADVPSNSSIDRWVTARLYDGNPDVRLAQYAVLGLGGIRALAALGIEPRTLHLNEGHAALAALELAAEDVARGAELDAALAKVRERLVFTTHTPVAAGNETYSPERLLAVLDGLPKRLGTDDKGFLSLGRVDPDDLHSEAGMTPIALRASRHVNGVSRRHGEVARGMWAGLFRVEPDEVPIAHVTNGVHLPTWMGGPMRAVLDRHLGEDWTRRAHDPDTWSPVADIPDAELWSARNEARARMIAHAQDRIATDRLARGESLDYVTKVVDGLEPDVLTIGFARRVAAYKRLYLLRHDPDRVLSLVDDPDPVQLIFAGKAHPADDGAKGILRSMFELKGAPHVAERVVFLEDYTMASGAMLTAGCDVWVNVPRPPLEASGTSGMKSALNGGLNLSVLDGWWPEAYEPGNGWAISGDESPDHGAQDAKHADELYGLLENEVVPTFHRRDADGVPRAWCRMIKASLASVGPRFAATRMMRDYVATVYRA